MIKINLLPIEERAQKRHLHLPNKWSILIYGLVLILVIVAAYYHFSLSAIHGALLEQKQTLAAEEQTLKAQIKAIEKMELQNSLLQERLSVVGHIEGKRYENLQWLNSLNQIMPGDLWLKTITRNPAGGRMTLEGMADGYSPVSQLMGGMETASVFDEVQLIKAERNNDDDHSLIYFNLNSRWSASGNRSDQAPATAAESK